MKRILAFVCMLSLVLSLGILPASAAAGDSMTLQYVSLRTTEGKEGIYFGANFTLTQNTIDNMECYGIALTPRQLDDWAANMGSKIQYSKYTGGLTAGKTTYVRSTSLVNILNISNDNLTNNNNAATTIYVKPYVKLSDGSYIFGEGGQISMKQVAKLIDQEYATLNDTQKMGLLGMYERFTNVMKGWGLSNLKKDYEGGNPLILQYRRNKVVANMYAQTQVLWTFTTEDGKPIQYSRTPNSAGIASDPAKDVYNLYPGRIYQGIPYTHGASSLDNFLKHGTVNENGVLVFENFHGSYFSGGSKTGTTTTTVGGVTVDISQYNASRLGNDCWDAISWAYESIGSSVSADQTSQLLPSYGMYPVGEYDITPALSSTGKSLDKVENVYTYYKDTVKDLQPMYRSYALMQPGDTLVNSTHSMMVVSVDVQYDSNGNVDPDKSTITFMDQASGAEEAQSKLDQTFNGTFTSYGAQGHSSGHVYESLGNMPIGNPAKCEKCAAEAGYNASTGHFVISNPGTTWTFATTFTKHNYCPVRPIELSDPTCKIPATRLSDSVSKPSSVLNIYNGKIDSTYRIHYITLDIFNNAGAKINSATCYGVQNGVTKPFDVSRFVYDQTRGAYGSVIAGTPAIKYMSATFPVLDEQGNQTYTYKESASGTYYKDAEGNYVEVPAEGVPEGTTLYTRTAATKTYNWLEAPDLEVGFYSFTMTCKLGNGAVKTIRSGYFQVAEGKDPHGNTVHLVGEE